MKFSTKFALFSLIFAIPLPGFAVNRAILVGVQTHQYLDPKKALQGCKNDVEAMASLIDRLSTGSLTPEILFDKTARKQDVLGKLKQIAKDSKPGDRLIFYFSGHGTMETDQSAIGLVMYDSKEGLPGTWLQRKELDDALAAIKGTKVAIIDACHAGGIIGKNANLGIRSRFIDLRAKSNSKTGPAHRIPTEIIEEAESYEESTSTQYLLACTVEQQAWEVPAGGAGKTGGVFTHQLMERLKNESSKKQTWGAVMDSVSEDVSLKMKEFGINQNPVASASALTASVSGTTAGIQSAQVSPESLRELFMRSRPDKDTFRVTADPPGTIRIPINSRMKMKVEAQQPGYFLLLQGFEDKATILFPGAAQKFDRLKGYMSSKVRTLSFTGNEVGSYQVKAFFFKGGSQERSVVEATEEVLQAFKSSTAKISDGSKSAISVSYDEYNTFEWTIEVANVLLGDFELNPKGISEFQKRLKTEGDPLGEHLAGIMKAIKSKATADSLNEENIIAVLNGIASSTQPRVFQETLVGNIRLKNADLAILRNPNEFSAEVNMKFLAAHFPDLIQGGGK